MFENVDRGMAMYDFTVLLGYINPHTLATREIVYGKTKLLASEWLLYICKNDLFLIYDPYTAISW